MYLRGLFRVHTFLRSAIAAHRPKRVQQLFIGRLTTDDLVHLEPLLETSQLDAPRFIPPWAGNIRSLAAYLSFSIIAGGIDATAC